MSITTLTAANRETITIGSESVSVITAGTQGPQGIQGLPGSGGSGFMSLNAGENLNATLPIVIDGLNNAFLADNTNPAHLGRVTGVSLSSALITAAISVAQIGKIANNSWTWSAGPIYVGAGALTQTIPASGFIQIVAIALSATEIIINVQLPIAR
jgi:hypothetical protein